MPKKKNLTGARILALALAFITLCLGGGVPLAVLFLPTAESGGRAFEGHLQADDAGRGGA